MRIWLTILFLFFCHCMLPQDTLLFYQKKNPSKEVKVKLEQYEVKVICYGHKRFSALISAYKDSAFVFRPLKRSKAARKEATALYDQAMDTAAAHEYTDLQFDSLQQAIAFNEKKIFYPSEITVPLSQVKKIKISTRNRPEKKRLVKRLDIAGYSALFAMLLVTPVTIFLAPLAVVPYVAIPSYGFGIGFVITDLILETKRVNLKSKWAVKTLM